MKTIFYRKPSFKRNFSNSLLKKLGALFLFSITVSVMQVNAQCTCTGNLVANPSFESGTTSWTWSGGNFNAGGGAVKCGSFSGDFEITNTSSNSVYQVVGTDLATGTVVNANVWSGTHDNSYSHKVFIHFYNSSNVYMSTGSVEVEVDKVLANSPTGPQLYTFSATVPSGAKYTRIGFKGTGNWVKTDMWCVTTTPASSCNAKVNTLYFNKLDGGADLPIPNGSTFTVAQLGSLYNLEAGTTGTVGSVKYTITGPTPTSNIENVIPYNSPGTGSGAWTGAAGSYSVNLKTYNAADAGGTLCHDTTISFTLISDCDCPGNLLTNGSFENTATGWSVSNGTLTFGTGYKMCGSYNGFLNWSSGIAKVWQDVTISAGSVLNFKGYAGTHAPGLACSPKLSLIFYNSANAIISQVDANVTYDVGSGNQLALYTINATAPAGTVKVRVQGSICCNTLKLDGFCLKVTPPASLGDLVWEDYNRNGLQDAGEPGIPNVTVVLKDNNGNTVGTTTTNASGIYSFTSLAPGTYSVTFTTPATYLPTPSNIGADDAKDSDPVAGVAGGIVLTAGQTNTTIDAGFYRLINLSGNVWHDENALTDNLVNKTNFTISIPTGLRVYLVNASTGLIERSTIVPSTGPNAGIFNFNDININTVYRVYLTNVFLTVGSSEPGTPTIIPGGWEHTGQKNANPPLNPLGSDGVNDGRVTVPGSVNNIININFGIRPSGGDVVQG